MKAIIKFLKMNIEELDQVNKTLEIEYPFMKLIDMYFWKIGIDIEKVSKNLN